ncbi:MAG TPA: haloacid dehalogenase type II [Candidatus Baltobacteraceae bacterium]
MDLLIFDVNETLLDTSALDTEFEETFGDASVRREWFALLLQRAFTVTITGSYRDFTSLARSALHMIAEKHGIVLDDASVGKILDPMKRLPPHPDVPDALQTLCDAGFTLTALTQSPDETLEAQMANSGLKRYFTRLFSVDRVERYKPDPAPYHMVASEMNCAIGDTRLIAAHEWDVEGAMRAGCKAAFVSRAGQVLDPDVNEPSIIGADLGEIAIELLGCAGAIKM